MTKLQEIFGRLDADGDGLISSAKMDTGCLTREMFDLFRPLFTELEQLQEPLNQEEFIDASLRLYDTLTSFEKSILMKFGKN